jgi:iron complex transport system substrate-binding protein
MRIVSLLPSATEILFAIGAGHQVVGVTHECDYPPSVLQLPKLTAASAPELDAPAEIDRHVRGAVHAGSSLYRLDSELLERLSPDLIVTQELCAVCAVSYEVVSAAVRRLRGDARIVSLEPLSLQDVFATVSFLGEITGHAAQTCALVAALDSRIDRLRQRSVPESRRPRTLVLEWTDPPMSAGHWIPELVEIAGGTPVLADAGASSRRIHWESVANADPDAVVVAPCGFNLSKTKQAIGALDAVAWWRSLRAVRDGRVLALDGNAFLSRPGPRLVKATEIMARWYTNGAEYAG